MKTINTDALLAITRARAALIIEAPFFGSLSLRMPFIEKSEIPTLAVDGKFIYYNAEYFLDLTPDLRKSAIAHEVMHPVLDHTGRMSGRDHKKWNRAADYALNPILKEAGFTIGEGWLCDPLYFDKSADEIYTLLPDEEDQGEGGSGSKNNGGGNGPQDEIMPGPSDTATFHSLAISC